MESLVYVYLSIVLCVNMISETRNTEGPYDDE